MNSTKIINLAVGAAAGFAATKVVGLAWKGITGHEPPKEISDDGEISLTEVVIFAAVSAAATALVQSFAQRGAKRLTARPMPR